ncbi:hypothetical protein [Staphylococcus equorum]|uniref:Uncharacterized protein n=1 Tax=Staphylococcus equorum TaxID=246432 RepID=A0AAP7LV60_9STAP|nr:hypothetical protein [Staphylococcus equorum]OEK59102.1 hypothetical protein ASS94_00110 [Staphylococcus equorum]
MTVEVKDKVEDRESWGTRIISVLALILVTIGGALSDTVLIPIIFYFVASVTIRNMGASKIANRYSDMNDIFIFSYGVVYLMNKAQPFDDIMKGIIGFSPNGLMVGLVWIAVTITIFAVVTIIVIKINKNNKESHWHK